MLVWLLVPVTILIAANSHASPPLHCVVYGEDTSVSEVSCPGCRRTQDKKVQREREREAARTAGVRERPGLLQMPSKFQVFSLFLHYINF